MKTITRDIIRFVKNKDEYQVQLIMQGYEHSTTYSGGIIVDKKILGVLKEEKLQEYLEFFIPSNYNIEVLNEHK